MTLATPTVTTDPTTISAQPAAPSAKPTGKPNGSAKPAKPTTAATAVVVTLAAGAAALPIPQPAPDADYAKMRPVDRLRSCTDTAERIADDARDFGRTYRFLLRLGQTEAAANVNRIYRDVVGVVCARLGALADADVNDRQHGEHWTPARCLQMLGQSEKRSDLRDAARRYLARPAKR